MAYGHYTGSPFERWFAGIQFNEKSRLTLYQQIIALTRTGLSKPEAIQMSWAVVSEEGAKPKEFDAIVMADVITKMQNGLTIGQALRRWIPREDVMVMEAIESSDDFASNLEEYVLMLQKKKKILSTILIGLAYPSVLISAIYAVLIYFGISVLPEIDSVLPKQQWTGPAASLAIMSDFSEKYALSTTVAFFALLAMIFSILPYWAGMGRKSADRFPIFSLYRMYSGLSFLMSMAALTQGGMSQMEAIDRLRPNSTRYARYRLDRVRTHMLNGDNFGAALHRTGLGWPDKKMNLQIKIYAETHDLSAQLGTLAKSWVDQAQLGIEKAMAAFKGFAMIVVFLGIFTVIGGMYALQDQIGLNAQMNAW